MEAIVFKTQVDPGELLITKVHRIPFADLEVGVKFYNKHELDFIKTGTSEGTHMSMNGGILFSLGFSEDEIITTISKEIQKSG